MPNGREEFIRETRGGVEPTTRPSGRNRERIREARKNRTLNQPPRWDQKIGDKIRSGVGQFPGIVAPAMQFMGSAWEGQARARENERILGGKIPTAVRQSVMTPSDQAFYDKYMRLGDMRSGKEAQEYYDMANTARRNQQISNRINYGLGIAGLDKTPWEGYESYKDGSRFDRGKFNESLRGIGESVIEGDGVTSLVDDTEQEVIDYGRDTFDIHPDKYPITDRVVEDEVVEDVYAGPLPHEGMPLLPVEAGQPPAGAVDVTGDPTRRRDVGYDITRSDLPVAPMPTPDYGDLEYFDWVDKYYNTHNPDGTPKADPTVISGGGTSYVDDFAEVEEAPPPIVPYDDSGREAGIAGLYGKGPRWGSTNRRYEKEYRDYVMSGGQQMDYDDFERRYEEIYQGKPHALHSSYR